MALTTTEEALVRQLLEQQAAILSLAESESTITSKLGATKVTIADLASASSIDDADLFLIRQGTTEKNVSGAVVKALASETVDGATETSAGIVELATAAETQTGTDNSRAVHPAGLASLTATETRKGLIEIANASEAQAGTDTDRAITPSGLRSGVNATGSAPIYACRAWVNFNGTGSVAIRASGNVSSITDNATGNYTINFATAMPDANYSAIGSCNAASNQAYVVCPNSSALFPFAPTASACRVTTSYAGAIGDLEYVNLAFYR